MRIHRPDTRIHPFKINLGCDPELFLEDGGAIIGSEKVVPTTLQNTPYCPITSASSKVVRDGVQVELQPMQSQCRETLISNLAWAFRQLEIQLSGRSASVNLSPVVEVSEAELASLSTASRTLGCAPSNNLHNPEATISVDPTTYKKRSAGGHLHFGLTDRLLAAREKMVPVLDILLGNTCVLLDDPVAAKERRQVYGRAGEYRLPEHGLEYRTLSNFWLRSPILASFVLGMGRLAACVVGSQAWDKEEVKKYWSDAATYTQNTPTILQDLLTCVDLRAVVEAINTGNREMALANWLALKPWFVEYAPEALWLGNFPNSVTADTFDLTTHFLTQPVEYWFPLDGFTAWINLNPREHFGWERFLDTVVRHDMRVRTLTGAVEQLQEAA